MRNALANIFAFIILAIPVAAVAALLFAALMGARQINRAAEDCTSRGGVQVRTYDGFVCISGSRPR